MKIQKLLTHNSFSKFDKCLTISRNDTKYLPCRPSTAFLIQQKYCEFFSASDWDEYCNNEFGMLKKNIYYALFGEPTMEITNSLEDKNSSSADQDPDLGYSKEQKKHVDKIYEKILVCKKFSAGGNRISMMKLFACCVPLQKDFSKCSNLENYANIESFKISVLPIFKIRKCIANDETCSSPCCLYIDDHGRIYKDWNNYMKDNKLPPGVLVLPKNGTYNFNGNNRQISLDILLSPASSKKTKALNVLNKVGTGVGLTSAGVFATALFLPVAAPVMITAAVGTVATGVFGTTVSSLTLKDRKVHGQSIGLKDPESRGCWLNIAGSTLGIAAGASSQILAVSVSRGIVIGQIARGAHNSLLFASTITNGLGISNGVYVMIDKFKTSGQTPTTLELLQMSSSLLFFFHSMINIKMASTLIEETQLSTIGNQRDMLRSNRHRKIFDKMAAETRRQNGDMKGNTQIIRSMKTISNKDSYFANTLKLNKQFNENNIKISFSGTDEVLLNGHHNISPDILINLNPTERVNLFTNIGPSKLIAKNSPTTVSFPNVSFNCVLGLRSIIKIVEMCHNCDDLERLIRNCVTNLTDGSFTFLNDLIQECINKLSDLAIEQIIALGIVNRKNMPLFLFEKFFEIVKMAGMNTHLSEILNNLTNSMKEGMIEFLLSMFENWLKLEFSKTGYTQISCSICNGIRFGN